METRVRQTRQRRDNRKSTSNLSAAAITRPKPKAIDLHGSRAYGVEWPWNLLPGFLSNIASA